MKTSFVGGAAVFLVMLGSCGSSLRAAEGKGTLPSYWLAVSDEKSGDVTLVDGTTQEGVATIPVGHRPRGIHASPDGRFVYVAISGTEAEGPPEGRGKGA